jgi:hypothetical protein
MLGIRLVVALPGVGALRAVSEEQRKIYGERANGLSIRGN